MRFKSKMKKTLDNKSGASLIFVLGVMLFLMAIGISTMAAAAANSVFIIRQNEYNEVMVLDKSIHENIMFSLQQQPDNSDDRENYLGYHFARYMLSEYKDNKDKPTPINGANDFVISLDGANISTLDNRINVVVTFDFPFLFTDSFTINGPVPAFPEDDPVFERVPTIITMSAMMEVRVDIILREGTNDERIISSVAVYEYSGGVLSDDLDGDHEFDTTGDVFWDDMEFIPSIPAIPGDPGDPEDTGTPGTLGGYGEWRLARYEVIDR